ncbi:NAD/NADP-dependent betaine aldehyde dehydrogenase [Streptomyces hirsutus]
MLEDADLEAVISTAAWGSFFHQGQICMTTGRHLVHASLYDEYVERLAAKADSLAVGDPHREQVHLGPLIDQGQLDKVHALVGASTAGGAKLAAGGTHDRLFYRPTVLADTDDDTPAYAEEVFGPVAPVRSFAGADEAAALVVFTDPEAASVGLSLAEASSAGHRVRAVGVDLASVAGAGLSGEGYTGRARMVVDLESVTLRGVAFFGPGVGALLHSAPFAVAALVPFAGVWHAVASYPSICEVWLRLLEAFRVA